jgi:hypothetical protein
VIRPRAKLAGRRVLVTLLAVFFIASAAIAQAVLAPRRIGVQWRGGVPRASFSVRDLFDRNVREQLGSGLRKRVVVTVQAFPEGGSSAVATLTRECAIMFDLWEDAYIVRSDHGTEVTRSIDAIAERCLVVRDTPIGERERYARWRGRRIFFAVRAEFDPISGRRCRELLRPSSSGSADPIGPIAINIVRREICRAERAIDFRSPGVSVP